MWDVLNAALARRPVQRHDQLDRPGQEHQGQDHDRRDRQGQAHRRRGGKPVATKAEPELQLPLFSLQQWKDSILARIVQKCSDRDYWDAWADGVVDITANSTARIKAILATGGDALQDQFDDFLDGLKANLNDSIGEDDAISMLQPAP